MSRSVSTHRHAVETVYLSYEEMGQERFDDFLLDLRQVLDGSAGAPGGKGFPSLRECNRWQDHEDHVVLENDRGEVSVSEYNGIVAVCLAPRDPDNGMDQGWCGHVSDHFRKLLQAAYSESALVSKGTFSNGEQCFELAKVPGSVVTSKEGRLEMFP